MENKPKQTKTDVIFASTIFEAKAPAKVNKEEEKKVEQPKKVEQTKKVVTKSATVKKPSYHENYY